jgi:hypothetical protein
VQCDESERQRIVGEELQRSTSESAAKSFNRIMRTETLSMQAYNSIQVFAP